MFFTWQAGKLASAWDSGISSGAIAGPRQGGSAITAAAKSSRSLRGTLEASATVAALLLFVVINAAFAAWMALSKVDRFQMIAHNWGWWAVKGLLEHEQPTDVMLVGSSLVVRILDEGEAAYLNQPLNSLEHRRCQHLEDRLSELLGGRVSTFSYAVGGLQASDVSVLTSSLLKGTRQPRAIVYGIAPRDVLNNMLASPCSTETYQIMSRLDDLSDVAYQARMNMNEKFDYLVGSNVARLMPLYDYRCELSRCFRHEYKGQANQLANQFVPDPRNPFTTVNQIVLGMIPEEVKGPFMITPFAANHPQCEENRVSYLFSYRPFRPRVYKTQFSFLERFLQIAKQRSIEVVFVNMPLRHDNYEAMLPGFYSLYKKDLQAMAARYNASLIDMSDNPIFHDGDFTDQVHLSGQGASKLVDALAEQLAPILVKQSLAHAGKQL